MSRIRTVKPEFWTDPEVVSCSMAARLFFIGCWNHADDYGVLKDEPERIRLQVMPADDVDAEAIVNELVERRLLLRMVTPDGAAVLVVRTFLVHQKIDKRSVGRYGDPQSFRPTESPPIPPSPAPVMEGKGLEGKGGETTPSADAEDETEPSPVSVVPASPSRATPQRKATDAEFDEFWETYPRREGKKRSRDLFDKAVRSGIDPQRITAAAALYRDLPGREPRFTARADTWLHQERWDDEPVPRNGGTPADRTRRNLVGGLTKDPPPSFRDRMVAASSAAGAIEATASETGGP